MRNVDCDIGIRVSPEKLILAFCDPELLRGWWGVERCLLELRAGGVYTLAWNISENGIKYVSSGIIRQYDPEGLLHIEKLVYLNPERSILGPQSLRVQADRSGSGCSVSLRQGPYPENAGADWDWYYEAVVDAWPVVLEGLKRFLEEKFPS